MIAFIGLGTMGWGMAMNLLKKSGEELIVYGRTDAKYAPFAAAGAMTTTRLEDVAKADHIFLCLPDDRVVEEVLFGEGSPENKGLFPHLRPGTVVVDFSTIRYEATLRIADRLREKGVHFLDAPVSGMEARAKDGTLAIMCGGEREVFERERRYFDCVGKTIHYMGGSGSGQLMKLVNQLLFDINAAAIAEVLPFATKLGLDPVKVGEIVNHGTGRSYASEFFIPRDLAGNFAEGYPLQKAYKDLVSAAEISARENIPLPVLDAAATTYKMALLMGLGGEGKGAMIKVYEKLLGVEFRE